MAAAKDDKGLEFVQTTLIPPLPTTERGYGIHLGGTDKIKQRIVYGSNENCVIRSTEDWNDCAMNSEHAVRVMAAKFSPNGEWVCSGDQSGQVYVWAHKSFVVKNTISVGKAVLDIAWSADGQRIVAVGRGKEEKGKVFPWNTNNKLGELSGAQKSLLCCDFKPSRPFRVVAGSEDFGVYFYKGPPFKFENAWKEHKNYVNAVAFDPKGAHYVSVSSDKTIAAFDAKTGEFKKRFATGSKKEAEAKGHHLRTIYELSWNPEGTHFATASADHTVKVWDFESGDVVHSFDFADAPTTDDMQISVLWMKGFLCSLSLSGKINVLDHELKERRPLRVVTGHRASILDFDVDAVHGAIFSVDAAARCVRTDLTTALCEDVNGGAVHEAPQIRFVRMNCDCSAFWTVASNDTLCHSVMAGGDEEKKEADDGALSMGSSVVKLDGAARGCAAGNVTPELLVVPTHKKKVIVVEGGEVKREWAVPFSPSCCALSADDSLLAVGSGRDGENAVYFYSTATGKEELVLKNAQYIRNEVVCVAMTADGAFLATADADRAIWIWDLKGRAFDKPVNATKGMKFHGAKIASLEFSPKAPYQLLSAAADSNMYLWTRPTEGLSKNVNLQHAFSGAIKKAMFLGDNHRVAAIGADSSIRFYDIRQKE